MRQLLTLPVCLCLCLGLSLGAVSGCQNVRAALGVQTTLSPTQQWQTRVDGLVATNRAIVFLLDAGRLNLDQVDQFERLKDAGKDTLAEARVSLDVGDVGDFYRRLHRFDEIHAQLLTLRLRNRD